MFVRVCYGLLAVCFCFLAYWLVIWVLGELGIRVPERILQVVFVIFVLYAIIGIVQGRVDWWRGPPA